MREVPKNHGTSCSVIFTSTAASAHGLPDMPVSPGLAWPSKLAALSRNVLRAGGHVREDVVVGARVALRGRRDRSVDARVLVERGGGERARVGLGLQLALVDVPVADVDGEDPEEQEQREEQADGDRDRAALLAHQADERVHGQRSTRIWLWPASDTGARPSIGKKVIVAFVATVTVVPTAQAPPL